MKAVVATCFESDEERALSVYNVLKDMGYDVSAVTSDFSHIRKAKRQEVPEVFTAIETSSYSRNLSLKRMASHFRFAKDLFSFLKKEEPDLIWLMVPANSMIREAKKYKQKHPELKLVIDVIDMWPESLPIRISKDIFPFNLWRNLRKNNISCADLLICECDLYQETLKEEFNKNAITTIHWARQGEAVICRPAYPEDRLSLCYIGSINHIIDVDRISEVISMSNMPVVLHVIGEGESTQLFINTLSKVCEVIYHGPIRDEKKKTEIFDLCHAGINIYREGLYIGLTVKCIDYFQHGLPIINNIKADTWKFVNDYEAGINIENGFVLDAEKLIEMRKNNQKIYDLFNENLSMNVFRKKCRQAIQEVMK